MTGSAYTAFVCCKPYGVSDIGCNQVTGSGYSRGYTLMAARAGRFTPGVRDAGTRGNGDRRSESSTQPPRSQTNVLR